MPKLSGTSHTVLLVSDIERSAAWYRRVFGFVVARDHIQEAGFSFTSLLHPESQAFVGLAQVDGGSGRAFDDRRIGLQHLGYHVPERSDVTDWATHLDALHIPHTELQEADFGAFIRFCDPDDIPLEVFWANRAFFVQRLRARFLEERRISRAASRRI